MRLNSLLIRLYKILEEKKAHLIYAPLVIYWIILFIFTTIPVNDMPKLFDVQDKLEHFSAYFILSILLFLTLHFQEKNIFLKRNVVYASIALILLYGALDELHQLLIPGRLADIADWIADSIGGSLGIFIVYWFLKSIQTQNG